MSAWSGSLALWCCNACGAITREEISNSTAIDGGSLPRFGHGCDCCHKGRREFIRRLTVADFNPFYVNGEWPDKSTFAWFWSFVCAHGIPEWCLGCPSFSLLFPDICAWACMKNRRRFAPPRPFNHELVTDDGVHRERWFCVDCQKWANEGCMKNHIVVPIREVS
jgi:hypothetical protein